MISLILFLTMLTGTQAVFAPVDRAALKAAVTACLAETADGSCPNFAASNATLGNPYGVIGSWDTSLVEDMREMFFEATAFNGDLSTWQTGAVTTMRGMFEMAFTFNGDISGWDTGNVRDMHYMFQDSGFTRTLCGGKWSLAFTSATGTNGRYGCCDAGTYMTDPFANQFDQSACSPCATVPVPYGTCTACTTAAASGCTAVTCATNRFDTNNNATDGCEAGCPSVTGVTCTNCSSTTECTAATCTVCTVATATDKSAKNLRAAYDGLNLC